MKPATVYVVDDDEALNESLRWLLESEGLRVETFSSAQAFLDGYRPDGPGCLVLDVRMPGMSGLELQERLVQRGIKIPVIVISGHGDIPMAVQALKAGALDFIEKPVDDRILMACVQAALAQDSQRSSARETLQTLRERADSLTPRERQVFGRAAEGQPNKQIAAELDLSEKTIEVHRSTLMRKLKVSSIAELVRAALALENDGWSPGADADTEG
jgi:RNA polymerase sigma factor (sigma-70 family)